MAYQHQHQHHPHPHHPPPEHGYSDFPQGQVVKIICKVDKGYNLAVRNDQPVVAPADSHDATQLWIKDCSYGERTKDNYGFPAFALINRATRKILKHSKEKGQAVILVDYQPGMVDEDILWSESQDFGEGFKTVRMASDTLLNMTLFHKEEKKSLFHHGGDKSDNEVKEGTPLVLDTWHQNDRQLWKLFNLCEYYIIHQSYSKFSRFLLVCKRHRLCICRTVVICIDVAMAFGQRWSFNWPYQIALMINTLNISIVAVTMAEASLVIL